MVKVMRFLLISGLALALPATILSMRTRQLQSLTHNQRFALGHQFYKAFKEASSNEEKIALLLLASTQHTKDSPKYLTLQEMLEERGFDPNGNNNDDAIIENIKKHYIPILEQQNFNTLGEMIDFLKSHIKPIDASDAAPFQALLNEALQSLMGKISRDNQKFLLSSLHPDFYRAFRGASDEDKILSILTAIHGYEKGSPPYMELHKMLLELGFDPNDINPNVFIEKTIKRYREQLENFNTLKKKINFLKSIMKPVREENPLTPLLNEGIQSLINELYEDEV